VASGYPTGQPTPHKPFPTFTTSGPRGSPGRKPAGVQQCTWEELQGWEQDQYSIGSPRTSIDKSIAESIKVISSECLMCPGFPLHYTVGCYSKQQRGREGYNDC
jgi:hypothetical protein